MRTCDRCGELLEAMDHENVDGDGDTIEVQGCIKCNYTTRVRL